MFSAFMSSYSSSGESNPASALLTRSVAHSICEARRAPPTTAEHLRKDLLFNPFLSAVSSAIFPCPPLRQYVIDPRLCYCRVGENGLLARIADLPRYLLSAHPLEHACFYLHRRFGEHLLKYLHLMRLQHLMDEALPVLRVAEGVRPARACAHAHGDHPLPQPVKAEVAL